MKRKTLLFCTLSVLLTSLFFLVTGSSILNYSLNKENSLPLGTFITWFGIISLPLSIYLGVSEFRNPTKKMTKAFANLLKIVLILSVFWIGISYLLAGNLSFSFSEKSTFQGGQLAMSIFWKTTYSLAITPIFLLIIYLFSKLFNKSN